MQSNKSEWEKSQTGPCLCRTLGSCFTLSGRGFVRGGARQGPWRSPSGGVRDRATAAATGPPLVCVPGAWRMSQRHGVGLTLA